MIQPCLVSRPRRPTVASNDVCSIVQPYFQLQIVYEDEYMAIVNKPAGTVIYPENGKNKNSILYALPYYLQRPTRLLLKTTDDEDDSGGSDDVDDSILDVPVPVHRLDFATSGLLVIGKTKHSTKFLSQQFEHRRAHKKYTAMVYGYPNPCNNNLNTTNVGNCGGIVQPLSLPEDDDDNNDSKGRSIVTMMPPTTAGDDDGWNLADCLIEGKRATTWWRLKSKHEFHQAMDVTASTSASNKKKNDTDDTGSYNNNKNTSSLSRSEVTPPPATKTATTTIRRRIPISMIEMKPITGRYHQLRRQMAYMYNTSIVGDPLYYSEQERGDGETEEFAAERQKRRYHRGLMLCSNEICIAHPFYNTPHGKKLWLLQQQQQLCSNSNNNDDSSPTTSSSSSSSSRHTTTAADNNAGLSSSASSASNFVYLFEAEDGTVMVNATINLPQKFDKFLKVMERMTNYSTTTTALENNVRSEP